VEDDDAIYWKFCSRCGSELKHIKETQYTYSRTTGKVIEIQVKVTCSNVKEGEPFGAFRHDWAVYFIKEDEEIGPKDVPF
jgi:hypothetical protein